MRMKRTLDQFARLERAVKQSSCGRRGINATFVYQDTESKLWTREVYERLANAAGPSGVRTTSWRISELSSPGVLAGAVSTASRADAIVIASRAEKLPLPFYVWVNSWLSSRRRSGGALVALLGTPAADAVEPAGVRDYLQVVAQSGSLELILQERQIQLEDEDRDWVRVRDTHEPVVLLRNLCDLKNAGSY